MTAAALFAVALAASIGLRRLLGSWSHPVGAYFALWAFVALLLVWNPVRLVSLSAETVTLILAGLGAIALGTWIAVAGGPPATRATAATHVPLGRFLIVSAVAVLGLAVGTLTVRNSIATAAGVPFASLTPSEVLRLTAFDAAGNAGVGSVLYLLAPVVAALGIVLVRRHVAGWLLIAVGLAATTLSPARTFPISTAVIALIFWLYSRPPARVRAGRASALLVAAVVSVGSIGYFIYQGNQLNKNTLATSAIPDAAIPPFLVPATVYLTAGPPSLSSAITDRVNPADGQAWHSVWILPRLASIVDSAVRVPDTVAGFVPIPFEFNTYTWIGDVWFDFGVTGILLMGLALGYTVSRVHAWALASRTYASAWVAAVVSGLLLFTIINLRFFWLECWVWLLLGTLVVYQAADRPRP